MRDGEGERGRVRDGGMVRGGVGRVWDGGMVRERGGE